MNEQSAGVLPDHCHPKIRQIHEYWCSIHPPEGLPARRHFDPLDIPSLLPNIALIDVPGQEKPFVSAYLKATESMAYNDLRATVADHLPRWRRGQAMFVRNREYVIIERLYLPFANDGATVNMMLGLILAKYGSNDFI